jgi:hypothetical protein
MMHDREKSDSAIVAESRRTKRVRTLRSRSKGNARQQSTHRAQDRKSVSQALERVRQAARQRKKRRFVGHRIGDPRIIRLIRKWLKAGVHLTSSAIASAHDGQRTRKTPRCFAASYLTSALRRCSPCEQRSGIWTSDDEPMCQWRISLGSSIHSCGAGSNTTGGSRERLWNHHFDTSTRRSRRG